MVEGFPLFATMAFVICCVTKEGGITRIKDWFGCRADLDVSLSTFYRDFFWKGKFNDQPVEDAQRRAFARDCESWIKQVQHERYHKSIFEFISKRCDKNPFGSGGGILEYEYSPF